MKNLLPLFALFPALVCLGCQPFHDPADAGPDASNPDDCNYIRSYDASSGCLVHCKDSKTLIECNRIDEEVVLPCQDGWYCCNAECLLMPNHDAGYEAGFPDTGIPSASYLVTGGRVSYTILGETVTMDSANGDFFEGAYRIMPTASMFMFAATSADSSHRVSFDMQPVVTIGLATQIQFSITHNSAYFGVQGMQVLGTVQSFEEIDSVWTGTGVFSGDVRQDQCCSGAYPEFTTVENGTFHIDFE